jgi:hypothetical protein
MDFNVVFSQPTFTGGDSVCGLVTATSKEALDILHATVTLLGDARVEWSTQISNVKTTYTASRRIVNLDHIAIAPNRDEAQHVSGGTAFHWPFAFALPSDAPPSCRTQKGRVEYSIRIFVRLKGMFTSNLKRQFNVPVCGAPIDLAALPAFVVPSVAHHSYQLTKSRGMQRVDIALPHSIAMIDGPSLAFVVRLNNTAMAANSKCTVHVIQNVEHIAKGHTHRCRTDFRIAEHELACPPFGIATLHTVAAMPTEVYQGQVLLPSFDIGLIKVTHTLTVKFNWGTDIARTILVLAPSDAARVALGSVSVDIPALARIWRAPWQPDAAALKCPTCEAAFGLFTRRHHCRACGLCYCSACCREEPMLLPPIFGFDNEMQRVCVRCRSQPGGPAASVEADINPRSVSEEKKESTHTVRV